MRCCCRECACCGFWSWWGRGCEYRYAVVFGVAADMEQMVIDITMNKTIVDGYAIR